MFKDNIKMAWDNITNNKMRSLLTMLGIVIGVASIIALITIVQGATSSITDEVSSFGANKVTAQVMGTGLKRGLLNTDIEKFEKIDNIKGISPLLNDISNVVYEDKVFEGVRVQGRNRVYFNETKDIIQYGRAINIIDAKQNNRVCLIGSEIVKEFFFGVNPIGKEIQIGGTTYKVIGTLKAPSRFSMDRNGEAIIIPYTTAMRSFGKRYINGIDFYMEDGELSNITTSRIEGVMKTIFNDKENAFTIFNMQNMLDSLKTMTGMMSMLLGGIAAISLLVGGIGIMNMMLVSVTERTTEIGLRKALGAEPRRIQEQFLIESVVLSLFGGAIGLVFGGLLAYGVCLMLDNPFELSIWTIILALGFSSGVGIIFGIVPARKASKLNPIDALRRV